jgi:hypothetical protein
VRNTAATRRSNQVSIAATGTGSRYTRLSVQLARTNDSAACRPQG